MSSDRVGAQAWEVGEGRRRASVSAQSVVAALHSSSIQLGNFFSGGALSTQRSTWPATKPPSSAECALRRTVAAASKRRSRKTALLLATGVRAPLKIHSSLKYKAR